MINLNTITFKAWKDIKDLDNKYVGTEDYIGVAFFWNYAYRHYLRDTTIAKRKKVHDRFLKDGLELDGISEKHLDIIKKVTGLD